MSIKKCWLGQACFGTWWSASALFSDIAPARMMQYFDNDDFDPQRVKKRQVSPNRDFG